MTFHRLFELHICAKIALALVVLFPKLISETYLGDYFHIAHTHHLRGEDVPFSSDDLLSDLCLWSKIAWVDFFLVSHLHPSRGGSVDVLFVAMTIDLLSNLLSTYNYITFVRFITKVGPGMIAAYGLLFSYNILILKALKYI